MFDIERYSGRVNGHVDRCCVTVKSHSDKVEGIGARQEACLLRSPLKWVDDDDSVSFAEHSQNYSLIASEINNHLLNEDKLNGNFSHTESATDMVNGTVTGSELCSSSNNLTAEKQESRSDCEYCPR